MEAIGPSYKSTALQKGGFALLATVATLIGVITLVPAAFWTSPTTDQVYHGFDPTLVYTSSSTVVAVTSDRIDANPAPSTPAIANLVTTSIPRFQASLQVQIYDPGLGHSTFRIGIWSPTTTDGAFLEFGPGSNGSVDVVLVRLSDLAHVHDELRRTTVLANYTLDAAYSVRLGVDISAGRAWIGLAQAGSAYSTLVLTAADVPGLFRGDPLSLSVISVADVGSPRNSISAYSLELPHSRYWVSKVEDWHVTAALLALAAAGLVSIVWLLPRGLARRIRSTTTPFRRRQLIPSLIVLIAAALLYSGANALLAMTPGHPFDIANEELYAYVSVHYGLPQLYFVPSLTSIPGIWGGVPYSPSEFPYEPVLGYYFLGVGLLSKALVGSLAHGAPNIAYLLKISNAAVGLADGALAYGILSRLGVAPRWTLIGTALLVFNPAGWFDQAVWGQTHMVSSFLVLLAIWTAVRGHPTVAWVALALASLTRPQMLVVGLLLALAFLRSFHWRTNVRSTAVATIVVFLILLPFTYFTSPSLPIDVMINNLRIQEPRDPSQVITTVSQGGYSIWPLVTYATTHTSGLARMFTSASTTLLGSVTYQEASQALTAIAIFIVGLLIWFQTTPKTGARSYLPLVALGTAAFLLLQTGLVSTHFVILIPLLVVCRPALTSLAYIATIGIWTLTTLISMSGEMAVSLINQGRVGDAPMVNSLISAAVWLYDGDRSITVAVTANICVSLWLLVSVVRPKPEVPFASSGPRQNPLASNV